MPGITYELHNRSFLIVGTSKFEQWITSQQYYHGFIPRQDVSSILTKHGDFLVRSTETTHTSKSKEVRRRISPIICVMLDPDNMYEDADESARLEMVRNLIIHLKSEKVYLDAKMKFDTPAQMFEHYQKNSFTINNRIKTDTDISKDLIRDVMKEARLMRGLQHPNVVNLYGVGMLDQPLYILLEYVAGGALKTYLRKNKDTITKAEKIQMSLGAAWGIDYLHKTNILHRDIAARNCLYDYDSAVKISDFGLSRIGSEYKMKTAKKMPIRWMAPESIVSFIFTRKTDVYSYGVRYNCNKIPHQKDVLVFEIWCSKDPYADAAASTARKKIIDGELNVFPSDTPEDLVTYVKEKLWNKNPEQREEMEKKMLAPRARKTVPTKTAADKRKLQVFKKLRKQNKSYQPQKKPDNTQSQVE
ncbi:SH2 domain protein [Teladorsagia circumcincta]|uniref:Tyrosine-protein kinase n=1 Tax=Teladorsagia circumcincta TaxID=45464 RepID=A0A2G9UPP6_TELCI|nr:SH2 domain protein [Teladorsagia circumcincta]